MSDFTQTLLLPPDAVEIRIRLGFVAVTAHAQVQVEAIEPGSKAVLAQWSRHHVDIADYELVFAEAVRKANAFVQEYVTPF